MKGVSDLLLEIKRLAPGLGIISRHSERVSLSSLIISTSHARSIFDNSAAHLHDCPIASGSSALPLACSTQEFLARPCLACLNFRVHHLASQAFCEEFCENCLSSSPNDCPVDLQKDLQQNFGSVKSFIGQLLDFTTSSRRSGRTWVIYNPSAKKISFVNLAGEEVPISLGLWPIAAVEMTEHILCKAIVVNKDTGDIRPSSWTRKSRNSLAAGALNGNSVSSVHHARQAVALQAVKRLNWNFMYHQLCQAKEYYGSDGRISAQTLWQEKQRTETLNAYRLQYGGQGANETNTGKPELHSSDQPDRLTSENSNQKNKKASSSTGISIDASAASAEQPQTFKRADGVWEYLFNDGRQTFVYPNGNHVYKEKNLTTTVLPDGSKVFEYANGTIITESNNTRVYKYPDGRTTQERIK